LSLSRQPVGHVYPDSIGKVQHASENLEGIFVDVRRNVKQEDKKKREENEKKKISKTRTQRTQPKAETLSFRV